jgi:hypothetical protein
MVPAAYYRHLCDRVGTSVKRSSTHASGHTAQAFAIAPHVCGNAWQARGHVFEEEFENPSESEATISIA